jgi:hypothetical protein
VGDDNDDTVVAAWIPKALLLLLLLPFTTDKFSRMARLIPVKYSRRESTLPFDDDRYAAFEDDVLLLYVGGSGGLVVAVEGVIVVE